MTDQERAANDLYVLRVKVARVEQRLEALTPVFERIAGHLRALVALKIEEMQQAESRHDHVIATVAKALSAAVSEAPNAG